MRIRLQEEEISPAVKEPGEYLETLSAYFMAYPECVEIWLRWNGYVTYRELCRDMKTSPLGVVTLLCEAKALDAWIREAKLCGSSEETTGLPTGSGRRLPPGGARPWT
jgi:hypothetical protein